MGAVVAKTPMKTMLSLATFIMGGLLFVRPAEARELEYQAPPGCPDGGEVRARIEKTAPEGNPAHISVVQDDLLFRGDLVIGAGEGRLKRTVTAKTCNAVVDALTLVVSLYRDPAESPTETLASTDEPPAPPYPAEQDRSEPRRAEARPASSAIALGLGATNTSWSGSPLLGLAVFGELGLTRGWWEPSVRLTLGRSFDREVDGGVAVGLTTASIEACPLGFRELVYARISICARSDVGTITAAVADVEPDTRRWLSAGGVVRARLELGPTTQTRPFVDVGGGLLAPLVRHRYQSSGGVTEVPVLQSTMAVAFGMVFP